ncbi:MAG: hypothetical protein V1831_03260 [Candidatus Woesearchaeota archaeon]
MRAIKDRELATLMKKIREVVGKDVRVIFKTTQTGSKLIGTINDVPDYDDDTPSVAAKDTPRIKVRKKDLSYVG